MKNNDKRTTKYLKISFMLIATLCVALFIFMAVFMNNATDKVIDSLGRRYMKEISSQLQQKFDTIVSLRAEQLEGLIERTPPTDENWSEELYKELEISAGVRDFTALGMYRHDGSVEMIYGGQITFTEEMTVNCNCERQHHMIHLGYDENGEKVFILGRVIGYPMSDGVKSDVLFAVLPFDYFNEAMYLATPETNVTSHIIDSEGNYIIKNGAAIEYDNAYERIENEITGIDGKEKSEYIKELEVALHNSEDYSSVYKIDDNLKRMYLVKIADNVDWYIMTVMPYAGIGDMISGLDTTRYSLMFGVVFVIIVIMLCVFIGYYRLANQQIKELNKARTEADKANKAKSNFLTSMSHDIRTPMNAIIGMSDIAMKNIENPEKATDCLKKVKLSSKHLLGLINDILDMSSIESGKLTMENRDVALHQLTSECVDIMQPQIKAKRQSFDVFIGNIISEHIYSDNVRLSQVLLNLLSNATKYTPEGGKIYLHIYQVPSALGDDYVKIYFEVEDNGIGMSEEFIKQIFERFAREDTETVRNISGSGLGMAITKSIVDMMDGNIEIDSKVGEGSKFKVYMDVKKAKVDEQDMKLPAWKALVVDDNEQLCRSAADTLEELGLIAEWTQDGMEAISMVEEHHKANDDYHFVLIDWRMPNMDGVETIREMRKRIQIDIPVFIISAYSEADVENVLEDTEIAGFISKPLFKSNLYTHLMQYIDHEALQENTTVEMDYFEGQTLLLAEDNDINAEIVEEVLSVYGLKVDRAINGSECVEIFEKAEVGYYAAVLMDVHMPIMDGYQATRAIRAMERQDSKLPIIAMTADVFSDNIENCIESGMNECITKPLDVEECIRVLRKYL